MFLFATWWISNLSLQASGLSLVYIIAHFYKCQHTLIMLPSLSQTTIPRFGDRGDGPIVRVITGVKKAHTGFTTHKHQEMTQLGWPFHTVPRKTALCQSGEKKLAVWGEIWAFKVLLFSMEEVNFSCIRWWFLGFVQQRNKQVYNYSFEECLKSINKH